MSVTQKKKAQPQPFPYTLHPVAESTLRLEIGLALLPFLLSEIVPFQGHRGSILDSRTMNMRDFKPFLLGTRVVLLSLVGERIQMI